MRKSIILLTALLLTACAHTRDPFPVQIVQPTDESLTCAQIRGEYCANVEIAAAKIEKNKSDDVNDALLVIFVWPGLADFKNADGVEGNALIDRCIYLKSVAVRKNCDLAGAPDLPMRYR